MWSSSKSLSNLVTGAFNLFKSLSYKAVHVNSSLIVGRRKFTEVDFTKLGWEVRI